jgi:hypothetical protein
VKALFAVDFTLVSSLAYPSTLKMEAIFSSEMEVDVQRTTPPIIPEDRTLQNVSLYAIGSLI